MSLPPPRPSQRHATAASAAHGQQHGSTRLPSVHVTQAWSGPTPPASSRAAHASGVSGGARVGVVDMGALAGPALSLDHALLYADVRRNKQQAQLIGHAQTARTAPAPPPSHAQPGHAQGQRAQSHSQPPSPSSVHVAAATSLSSSSSRLSRLYPASSSPPARDPLGPPPSVYGGDFRPPPPFAPRVLPSALTHPSPVMTFWMNQMETEKLTDHSSDLIIWERQLSEMLARSGLDDLTPQRAALVCDLIDQVAAHVGRWAPILRRIVRELFASVFQGYDMEDLDERVPLWSAAGASWVGWTAPRYGNALDDPKGGLQRMMAALGSWHPLSPLVEHGQEGGGSGGGSGGHGGGMGPLSIADAFAVPLSFVEPAPPRTHFFRRELWELNKATWADLLAKQEEAQMQLAEHRARVAADLGMVFSQSGQLAVAAPPQPQVQSQPQPQQSQPEQEQEEEGEEEEATRKGEKKPSVFSFQPISIQTEHAVGAEGADGGGGGDASAVAPEAEGGDVISPLPSPAPSPRLSRSHSHSQSQSQSQLQQHLQPQLPRPSSTTGSRRLGLGLGGAGSTTGAASSSSSALHSSTSVTALASSSSSGSHGLGLGLGLRPSTSQSGVGSRPGTGARPMRSISLSLSLGAAGGGGSGGPASPLGHLVVPPALGSPSGSGGRPRSSLQLQRQQSIIETATEAALLARERSVSPHPHPLSHAHGHSPMSPASATLSLSAASAPGSVRPSPRLVPLTEASMASLDSSAMGAMLSQAMALSSAETGVPVQSYTPSSAGAAAAATASAAAAASPAASAAATPSTAALARLQSVDKHVRVAGATPTVAATAAGAAGEEKEHQPETALQQMQRAQRRQTDPSAAAVAADDAPEAGAVGSTGATTSTPSPPSSSGAETAAASMTVAVIPPAPSSRNGSSSIVIGGRSSSASLDTTEAVTAAAFHTINALVSTPPIPGRCLIPYFDVRKRLDMQYHNLYRRIRTWAQKQTDMQTGRTGRDVVLNRIAKQLKRTLFVHMFGRWKEVVAQRRRQCDAWAALHTRFMHAPSHLASHFLSWRITALRRRTLATERSVRDTDARNLVLQSEINEQRYVLQKESEKRDALLAVEGTLTAERDELRNFLEQCQQQIRAVQGAQVTHVIAGSIALMEHSVMALWSELKAARDMKLQDATRMLVSSTVLLEHVQKPYSSMPEASPQWVAARRDEVKRARNRFAHMLDSDLLLLWLNFHLASAELKIRQDQLAAKFHGKTYKYDVAGAYQPHVRQFYSSDHSLMRRAENFTSSLQDCEVLLRLLSQVAPHLCDVDVLAHVDLEARGRKTLRLLSALSPQAASMLSPMDLTHSFSPDLAAALLARIMMTHPTMPIDTSALNDPRKKTRSEYEPEPRRVLNAAEAAREALLHSMTHEHGLSAAGAARAQRMMDESARVENLSANEAAEAAARHTHPDLVAGPLAAGLDRADAFMTHQRDEAPVVAQTRERRNAARATGGVGSGEGEGEGGDDVPSILRELEEADAQRAVKDAGPFTQMLRALHLVKRELTTRARVEVGLVTHVTHSVRKVLADVRVLLDDAYERDALWQTVRRRVGAFVATILAHQMRGEPLPMQDRKAIRQIRRYTKLLTRDGAVQPRFLDLLHPWNRTNQPPQSTSTTLQNRTLAAGGIKEEGEDSDEEEEEDSDEEKEEKDSDGGASASSASSSSSSSDDDSDGDDSDAEAGTRTAEGDDLWREHRARSRRLLGTLSLEEQERHERRLRERGETREDLLAQLVFELSKCQEMVAKHYTALRDIFRAYAQMDHTTEAAFRAREEERSNTGSAGGTTLVGIKGLDEKDDPTAPIRRKLREAAAAASSNSSSHHGSSGGHAESNPQFSIHEFWLMARDCRLLTPHFGAKRLARIFEYVWARDLRAALVASGAIPESTTVEAVIRERGGHVMGQGAGSGTGQGQGQAQQHYRMEVDCRQFVEILIRIAHQRMPSAREREELLAELELDREADVERRRAEGGGPGHGHGTGAGGGIGGGGDKHHASAGASASDGSPLSGGEAGSGPNGASNVSNNPSGTASSSSNPAFEWGVPLTVSTRPGLALRLFHLIRCRLMPSAARLNVDNFRAQYKRIEVSALYKKHGGPLRRLFYRYAKMHSVRANRLNQHADDDASEDGSVSGATTGGGSSAAALAAEAVWTNTIDYKEFVQLLRDSKLLDGRHLTLQTVYAIFSNVQSDLAKVAPPLAEVRAAAAAAAAAKEKDKEKEKRAKRRGTQPRKLELPGASSGGASGGTPGDSVVQSTAASSHAGSAATSRVGSRRGSGTSTSTGTSAGAGTATLTVPGGGEWGSSAITGRANGTGTGTGMSLQELDLESLAAASSVPPTDEQILAQQSATSHTELIFNEFLEALAAIAAIRHPNPYKPLHVRIAHFLERDLLPWISLIFSNQKE